MGRLNERGTGHSQHISKVIDFDPKQRKRRKENGASKGEEAEKRKKWRQRRKWR